jgi:localization factor PodJL
MARANPQIAQRVIDPNLPPDQPLEPGTGIGRGRISTPAERIAASEADLGRAKPPIIPDPGGKSDFIAAARRAAQAAAADPLPGDRHAAADPQSGDDDTLGKKIAHRMRSLFVGVSVVLIAGGALHVTLNLLDSADRPEAPAVTRAENAAPGTKPADFIAALPAAPAPKTTESADNAGHMNVLPDITGSIQSPTLLSPPESASPRPPGGDKLPVAIGGPALRMAAAAGNAVAEYEVGVRYAEGRGVALNPAEAARWFEYAARQGLTPAQFRLAGLYEKGTGMKKDLEAARRLYLAAAEKGHAKAMHNLAVLYAEGGAAKPDYRMALQWFRKAADYGVSDSQYNLAILYARGIGVEQNLVESYKWFSIAAAAGDPEAVKKRDEIGSRLDAQSLTGARAAAQAWTAQPQPEEATRVDPPPGGWDAATSSNPAPKPKSRASSPIKIGGI